jgi:hypothetical protein
MKKWKVKVKVRNNNKSSLSHESEEKMNNIKTHLSSSI